MLLRSLRYLSSFSTTSNSYVTILYFDHFFIQGCPKEEDEFLPGSFWKFSPNTSPFELRFCKLEKKDAKLTTHVRIRGSNRVRPSSDHFPFVVVLKDPEFLSSCSLSVQNQAHYLNYNLTALRFE